MAGRKVDLAALGARVQEGSSAEPAEPPAATPPAATKPKTRSRTPAPGTWVRYDELERKETRLRADQYRQLSDLSRHLNRLRAGDGERITENTLIRVAIDLLLDRTDSLAGTTEIALRKSVGL